MSSFFICRRCAQRLAFQPKKLSRNYGSLREGKDDGNAFPPNRPPAFHFDNSRGSSDDKRKRAQEDRRYHNAQRRTRDKALESLFSSNRVSNEQSSISRYSRTPIASGDWITAVDTSLSRSSKITPPPAPTPVPAHKPAPVSTSTASTTLLPIALQHDAESNGVIDNIFLDRRHEKLDNLLQSEIVDLDQIGHAYRKLLSSPKVRQRGPSRAAEQEDSYQATLHRALQVLCQKSHYAAGPVVFPSTVIKSYLHYEQMGDWWGSCLWTLLGRYSSLRYGSVDNGSKQTDQEGMSWLLTEIIEVWRLYLRACAGVSTKKLTPEDETRPMKERDEYDSTKSTLQQLPLADDVSTGWPDFVFATMKPMDHAKTMSERFAHYMPKRSTHDGNSGQNQDKIYFNDVKVTHETTASKSFQEIPPAAAMTLDCIKLAKSTNSLEVATWEDVKPFADFLDTVVGFLPSGYRTARNALVRNGVSLDVVNRALSHWLAQAGKASMPANDGIVVRRMPTRGANKAIPEADRLSAFVVEMSKAVKRSNADIAVQVWEKARQTLDRKDTDLVSAKVENLYSHFLSGFFQLRRAETATQVWNHMVQNGHQITKVHWTAMLHGCIRAHDAASLKDIWANMQRSSITPDTAAWTTYICGLIKCRQWRGGIEALDQLGGIWKSRKNVKLSHRSRPAASEPDTQEDQPTPSLAPVNAALAALVDLERLDLADNVLGWASSHGLQPDTHTHNILLRPSARAGDLAAIQSHLATMSASKCEPDIATFTIILSSLVSSPNSQFRHLTPSNQESTILFLLNAMLAANIPPNTHTYSALLSALLQPRSENRKYDPNNQPQDTPLAKSNPTSPIGISAAHTVLAHMANNSIAPTPHIYTILLTHYFSQTPPDLPAIRSLWHSLQAAGPSSAATLADPILCDRMIEGLADAGQARDSLAFLAGMVEGEGRVPGWVALGKVLDGLLREGDLEGLGWLVRRVEARGIRGEGEGESIKGEGGLLRWGERELRGKTGWERRIEGLRRDGVLVDDDVKDGGGEKRDR